MGALVVISIIVGFGMSGGLIFCLSTASEELEDCAENSVDRLRFVSDMRMCGFLLALYITLTITCLVLAFTRMSS